MKLFIALVSRIGGYNGSLMPGYRIRLVLLGALMIFSKLAFPQHTFKALLKDASTNAPLPGVTVIFKGVNINKEVRSDSIGTVVIDDMAPGLYEIEARHVGYVALFDRVIIPAEMMTLYMEPAEHDLEEVIVSTTRSSRTIESVPTRIEVIAGEELDEKGNMKPGDIRMILNESTGIQTQQTSATSGNASIRIQGLDGRYTQILKDGFPLYSGAASGLGLLQIPPLDLKQVEVIKGSASTLYGGGAIAGLVNLVSKTPAEDRELNFHLNGTSAGGLDLNGFYSEVYGKAGLTVFAARNSNSPYDPAGIDLTATPKFERYTFNPKLFLDAGDATRITIGINSSFETRTGGDMHYIEGRGDNIHRYFERNETSRISSQFFLEHKLNKTSGVSVRNSASYFTRGITIPGYDFKGTQHATFSEITYNAGTNNSEWVAGLNLWTDKFSEDRKTSSPSRKYSQITLGGFLQNNIHVSRWMELETGLRADHVADYGFVLLPRASALFKINKHLSSRMGGGLGYKTPSIFTEESERIQYQNVLPIDPAVNNLERSYGLNWDINYRTLILNGQVSFSINNLFFYTRLNDPLLMRAAGAGFRFENLPGHIDTKGIETNVKIVWQDFKLFTGYTLTDTRVHEGNTYSINPLTAKHRLNNVLMYELEDEWKLGAEAYYYSPQLLNNGLKGREYWIFGFMAEKLWDKFSIYINFENFTDTRQTRFGSIYTGGISSPVFNDIYAPLDGFVINGGLKLRL